ncbi:hypothetical protein ACFOHW_23785 [Paenibacillus abyssi]
MGQIRGYHNDTEPDLLFWRIYSLYLARNLISSIVWIKKAKPGETTIMLEKIYKAIEDHDYFERVIPKWYEEV